MLNHLSGPHVFHSVAVTDVDKLKNAVAFCALHLFDANALAIADDPTLLPIPGAADPSPSANAQYFQVNSKERRVVFAVELTAAGDTLEIAERHGAATTFTPFAATVTKCPTHAFVIVDLDSIFGAGAILQTEWRITLLSGATHVADLDKRLLAFVDLHAKADHVFDKQEYRTGEPVKVTVRLREGDKPITGARVSVALKRPRRSLGDFLARNSAAVIKVGALARGDDRQSRIGGDASAKWALLAAILQARGETDLGYEEPPGIFADGTNDLHDPEGTGNYSNVYTQTDKEGAISFTFESAGKLGDGSAFSRLISASKWIGVNVDPVLSGVSVLYNQPAPAGFQAVQVTYKPVDRFGNLLGPFRASEITFHTTAGAFDGDVVSELDGTYHQTLLYKKEDGTPIVTVETQGKSTVPLPVSRGCLSLLLRPLLWLIALILRLIDRGKP